MYLPFLKIMEKIKLSSLEKKKYVLPTERDIEILRKCKQLEKLELDKSDRFLVKFIKTQLEADWRKYLLEELNKLIKKYEE